VKVIDQELSLRSIAYELCGKPHDVGKLIGPSGCMVDAIQNLWGIMGGHIGKSVVINVNRTETREKKYKQFKLNPHYSEMFDYNLLHDLAEFVFNDGVEIEVQYPDSETTRFVVKTDEKCDHLLEIGFNTIFAAIGYQVGRRLQVRIQRI
jgi:predicted RNA-binding protein YlqC (UPF0109 family)